MRKNCVDLIYQEEDEGIRERVFINELAAMVKSDSTQATDAAASTAADSAYLVDKQTLLNELVEMLEVAYDAEVTLMGGVLMLSFSNGERFCLQLSKLRNATKKLS